MFVNKDSFGDALYWYQKKIGSYDQPQWEKSVEERVLNGINLNVAKKVNKLKNSLIDLDYIRGSAFNKNKPKQSWLTTTYYGIVRVLLLPVYLNWWINQTNKKICFILLTLYVLQLCSMCIFFNNDLNDKNVREIPQSEVIAPLFMFFFLGVLYSQIFASSGNHFTNRNKNYLKSTQLNGLNLKDKQNEESSPAEVCETVPEKKQNANQQVKSNQTNHQKYTNTSKLNKQNKARLKFTCSTKARTFLRAGKTEKRKRHLTAPNNSTTAILQSSLKHEQRSMINEEQANEQTNEQTDAQTKQQANSSAKNQTDGQTIRTKISAFDVSNTPIDRLKEELKNLDEDDVSTSGEDCSPYSSISSSANLSKLLVIHNKENEPNDEEKKVKLNSDEEANYFEQSIYQPKKSKYFYFQEYKEVLKDKKSSSFNYDEQNDFKRKNACNISDSESGSVSPTTPMKSLNDWPMINSDNSTEDEDEEVLINQVEEEKVEQQPIKQPTIEPIDNESTKHEHQRLNSLNNKSLNLLQDESDMKTDSVDKISCSIYQQDQQEWQKINLSMIDISSMIIKKVDTVRYTNEYFYFAILFSLLFAFIPQIFRFQAICSNLNANFLQSSSLGSLIADKRMTNCDQNNLEILDAYGLRKNASDECRILMNSIDGSKVNKSAFVCGAINGSNSTEELIEYLNLPVLVFDLLIDVFKNSIYSFPMKFIVFVALIQRFTLSLLFFILLCVAERTYRERFLYAKYFCHLTSARRAKRNDLPHFRLNKVQNIKSWLSIRSFLKKHGPQRSVDSIVSTSFILAVSLLTFLCIQLLRESEIFSENLYCYEMLVWDLAIGIFIMRLIILGSKMNRKYKSNLSVLITEQINLYLTLEQNPHKKERLTLANNVLKLAADLLKQLEVPFKISGFSANPYLYNITKYFMSLADTYFARSLAKKITCEILAHEHKNAKINLNSEIGD